MTGYTITNRVNGENLDLVELIDQPTWKTILLDLVKTNKMNPWDIDVVLLAEKYLAKINALEEGNLRLPANAILASAILLKYKSKALKIPSLEEVEEELSEEQQKARQKLFLAEGVPELVAPRFMREGKVSLDDLVSAIEGILAKTKRKRMIESQRRELEFQIPLIKERVEERMKKVLKELKEQADEEGLVLFSRLVEDKREVDIVAVFITLLFLCNEGKISLTQDEFFGEIFIHVND